jgi:hypothetical protein
MLDFIGTMVAATVIIVNFTALASTMPIRLGQRLTLAIAAGAWVGLAAALAAAGKLADATSLFPMIGIMFALPLCATAGAALLFPAVRTALLAIPMPLLIGLNVSRVFGVLFLLLAEVGRLSGPFPLFAGWGDIVTGALAIPVAWLAVAASAKHDGIVTAWNVFGALDLIVAVALGITSTNGSPLQLFHAGVGSAAMQSLPFSLVPTVLVPFYLIGHAIVFAQLRARAFSD